MRPPPSLIVHRRPHGSSPLIACPQSPSSSHYLHLCSSAFNSSSDGERIPTTMRQTHPPCLFDVLTKVLRCGSRRISKQRGQEKELSFGCVCLSVCLYGCPPTPSLPRSPTQCASRGSTDCEPKSGLTWLPTASSATELSHLTSCLSASAPAPGPLVRLLPAEPAARPLAQKARTQLHFRSESELIFNCISSNAY